MNVSAVILVGGKASRMGNITRCIPKSMLLFNKIPFLEYLVRWLQKYKVNQIILSVGHLSEAIYYHFDKNDFKSIDFVQQPEVLEETGGAIAQATQYVLYDNFFVLNGDTIFSFEINKVLDYHYSHIFPVTQILSSISNQNQGAIKVGKESRIVLSSYESEICSNNESLDVENFSSSGVYLMNTQFIKDNLKRERVSFEKSVIPKFIQQRKVVAYIEKSAIYDFGTPERYIDAKKLDIKTFYL